MQNMDYGNGRFLYIVMFFSLIIFFFIGCGGGGGSDDSTSPSSPTLSDDSTSPSSPTLSSATLPQNSFIASSILDSFQINISFSDPEADLNGGTFCVKWEEYTQCLELDSSYEYVYRGDRQIIFPLFLTPPLVGDIKVQCFLTDKVGNQSNSKNLSFSQTRPFWPWQIGSKHNDEGYDIYVDNEDNIFVACNFNFRSYFKMKGFVAKYSPDAFCHQIIILDNLITRAITVDDEKNMYFAGVTYPDIPENYSSKAIVTKYDSNGSLLWKETLSANSSNGAMGITLDRDGNVYATGFIWGALDENIPSGKSYPDIFIVKYDSYGVIQWTKYIGTGSDDAGNKIQVDSDGNVYVTGYTGSHLDGQDKPGSYTSSSSFLVKYDSLGNKIWTKLFGITSNPNQADIAIDDSDNIYIAGLTVSELNQNAEIGYIRKFNESGELKWTRLLGGASWYAACRAISLDNSGNIVVTGLAYGSGDSDTPTDSADAFVAKYDSSGTNIWFTLFSTPGGEHASSISVDSNNYIYITGATNDSLSVHANFGYEDIFIARFSPSGILED